MRRINRKSMQGMWVPWWYGWTSLFNGGRNETSSLSDLWSLQLKQSFDSSQAFKTSSGHYFTWSLEETGDDECICAHTMVFHNESLLLFGGFGVIYSVSNCLSRYTIGSSRGWTDVELTVKVPPMFGHSMILTCGTEPQSAQIVIAAGMSVDPEDDTMIIIHLTSE